MIFSINIIIKNIGIIINSICITYNKIAIYHIIFLIIIYLIELILKNIKFF